MKGNKTWLDFAKKKLGLRLNSTPTTNENRTWLAFANENRCNHYACLKEKGFISWRKERNNFQVGDIVYLFSSKERKIIFKTVVVGEEPRADKEYWNENAPDDLTWRLELLDEYTGDLLNESTLIRHGFKGGRSLQHPMCDKCDKPYRPDKQKLFDYIKSQF